MELIKKLLVTIIILSITFGGVIMPTKVYAYSALEEEALSAMKKEKGWQGVLSVESFSKYGDKIILEETNERICYKIPFISQVYITYKENGTGTIGTYIYTKTTYESLAEPKQQTNTNTSTTKKKSSYKANNSVPENPTEDPYYDIEYEESYVAPQPEPEPTPVTIYATKVESALTSNGILRFGVTFSEAIKVEKAPVLKIKIGDEEIEPTYKTVSNNKISYQFLLNKTKYCGKKVTFVSLGAVDTNNEGAGEVQSIKGNTITTMDYTSKLETPELGEIGNFILVDKGARGDINCDKRIDELDVKELEKNIKDKTTNKLDSTIADVTGDGKIDTADTEALQKAIDKQSLRYINFLVVGDIEIEGIKLNRVNGDVTGPNGKSDGIINYLDAEYIQNMAKKGTHIQKEIEACDVDGDNKITIQDYMYVWKAIETRRPNVYNVCKNTRYRKCSKHI